MGFPNYVTIMYYTIHKIHAFLWAWFVSSFIYVW